MRIGLPAAFLLCFISILSAAEAPFYTRNPRDPALILPETGIGWRDPSPAVFQEAAKSGKPLFLFVTAEWIKAGNEMERVTFGDVEIATRLREEFIPVKIDRDVFPDIDLSLQQAVAALSGTRGWPLCAFVTPDGHVFAGGTFFPADDDPLTQKPGLRNVIFQVVRAWKENRAVAQKAGEALTAELAKIEAKPPLADIPADLLKGVVEGLSAEQQAAEGRPAGTMVRFPAPRALLASLYHAERTRDEALRKRTLQQLDAMLSGALYDCLDQGFFRCATDGNWRVPRFEKLLVQNAEMLRLLHAAWQLTGDTRYQRLFGHTTAMIQRRFKAGDLYVSALAGGSSDITDGDPYTFTVREIEQYLPDETDQRLVKRVFDIGEKGDLPSGGMHANVLPNALHDSESVTSITRGMGLEGPQIQRLQKALQTLIISQNRRPYPQRSNVICIDANALYAAAQIEVEIPAWREAGLLLLRNVLKHAGTHAISAQGPVLSKALLSDEAALALACASAFEATGDAEFEKQGVACLERIEKNFMDKDGTFFDRPAANALFPAAASRLKLYADTWEPAPLGLAAQAFLRWSALLDRPAYWMRAKQCVQGCGEIIEGLGHYGATLATAADWLKLGGVTITIVSKNPKPGDSRPITKEDVKIWEWEGPFRDVALRSFAPAKTVRRVAMPEGAVEGVPQSLNVYVVVEKNGKRTLTTSAEKLQQALRE